MAGKQNFQLEENDSPETWGKRAFAVTCVAGQSSQFLAAVLQIKGEDGFRSFFHDVGPSNCFLSEYLAINQALTLALEHNVSEIDVQVYRDKYVIDRIFVQSSVSCWKQRLQINLYHEIASQFKVQPRITVHDPYGELFYALKFITEEKFTTVYSELQNHLRDKLGKTLTRNLQEAKYVSQAN